MKVCFLLERGSPPRTNPILAEVFSGLQARGVQVTTLYPEETIVQLDALRVEADLYLLKSDTEFAFSLAVALERIGARVLNTCCASALVKDKVLAAMILQQAGLPGPRAFTANHPAQLTAALAGQALIFKPQRGYHGAGISIARVPADLPAASLYPETVFAQHYLAEARVDLKVFAIGDDVFGVRKPFSAHSYQQSGLPVPLSSRVQDLARRCGQAFGLSLYGLDVAETDEGEVIIDVNYFPGYRGVPGAARHLTQHILTTLRSALANGDVCAAEARRTA